LLFKSVSVGVLCLVCLGMSVSLALAQDLSAVSGVVVDQLGGVIGGARLTVRDAVGAVIRTATTDRTGAFSVPGLSSGSYDLHVESQFFEPTQLRVDVVQGGPSPLLRLTMKIAALVEDVVVTGRRVESRSSETPQKIEVITREDIERSAALDVTDVLKKNAAVDVAQYGGVISGIGIRGFRPEAEGLNRRSLLLIDGRPAGNTNLATLLLDNVERIEVQKGPSSALYGASAVGGVVNIITRQRRGPIAGQVSAGYGSFNTYDVHGEASGSLSTPAYFSVTARRYDQQDDYTSGHNFKGPLAATGKRPFTSYATNAATGKLGYDLSPHWTMEANGDFYQARDVQLPGNDQITALGTSFANLGSKDLDRYNSDVRLNGKYGRLAPSVVVYHAREQSEYTRVTSVNPADQLFVPFRFFANNLHYFGVQARNDWSWWRSHRLVFGIDYDHVKSVSRSWLNNGMEAPPFSPDNTRATVGIFAKNTFRFRDGRTILETGGRVDRIDAATLNSVLRSNFTGSETAFTHFSPSGGFKHQLWRGWRAHGTAGSGFVVPDAGALTGQTVFTLSASNGELTSATIITGNPNLKPESATSWDLGLDWSGHVGHLDLTYFDTSVSDRIVSSVINRNPITSLCPRSGSGQQLSCIYFTYANANTSSMQGIELDTRLKIATPVQLFVNTNYYFERVDQLDAGNRDIYGVPRYTLRAGIDYQRRQFSGRLSARAVGHQKNNDFTVTGYPEITYPAFAVADATVRYELPQKQHVDLTVNNLLDANYYESKGYTLAGRSLVIRYHYGF
jgi:outer membrane receptor protein involved in Fe transport